MEVILKQDIKGLGYKNDLVDVKPGYGRNYLIPQGMALIADTANKKMMEENARQAEHKEAKKIEEAKTIAKKLESSILKIATKVGDGGSKIFGSITTLQLAETIKAQTGVEIDKRSIKIIGKKIKEVGEYDATVELYKGVDAEIKFSVVDEDAKKGKAKAEKKSDSTKPAPSDKEEAKEPAEAEEKD